MAPVRVDADGLDPAALPRASGKIRLLYVTPSHQFPTGAVLPVARRYSLRAWAHARGVYVIEDDYDGELRYHSRPTKAVAGLEPDDDVIYCGTFAKSLFPSVRLAYMALPASLMHAAVRAKWLTDRGSSKLLQHLVTELMTTGAYDRYIRRMQRRYTSRRAALVRALTQHLGSDVAIAGDAAGMHLVAWFPHLTATEIDALVARCRQADVGVYSIAKHAVRPLARQGLILGYGLVDEQAIEAGVSAIASAYREVKHSGRPRAGSLRVAAVEA